MPALSGATRCARTAAWELVSSSVRPGERNGILFVPPSTFRYVGLSVPAAMRCGTLGSALELPGCRVTATTVVTAIIPIIQIRRFTFPPLPNAGVDPLPEARTMSTSPAHSDPPFGLIGIDERTHSTLMLTAICGECISVVYRGLCTTTPTGPRVGRSDRQGELAMDQPTRRPLPATADARRIPIQLLGLSPRSRILNCRRQSATATYRPY